MCVKCATMLRGINRLLEKALEKLTVSNYLLILLIVYCIALFFLNVLPLPIFTRDSTFVTALLLSVMFFMSIMPSVVQRRILPWNMIGTVLVVVLAVVGFLVGDVRFTQAAAVTAFILLISTVVIKPTQPTAKMRRAYDARQWADVVKESTKLIEQGKELIPAYWGRGYAYWTQGNAELAKQDLDELIRLNPDDPQSLTLRGQIYARLEEADAAIADYTQALENTEQQNQSALAKLHSMRGREYYNQKRWSLAFEDFEIAIHLGEESTWIFSVVAFCLDNLEQYERAIQYVNSGLAIETTYTLLIQRAALFCKSGKFDEALKDCNTVIVKDANYVSAYQWRGYTQMKRKQYVAAEADYSKAIQLSGEAVDKRLFQWRSQARISIENYKDAIDDIDMARKIGGNTWALMLNRAFAQFALGQYPLAHADLQQAALLTDADAITGSHHISSLQLLNMLHAWVAYKSGDAAAAAERWRALVAQDARFGDADWLMQELDFSALEDETTRGILQHITPNTLA